MNPVQKRHWLMGGALALTIAATLWASQMGDGDEAKPLAGAGNRAPAANAAPKLTAKTTQAPVRQAASLSAVPRAPWPAASATQLAAWMPPPPPPPPPAPAMTQPQPVVPVAPPLPYELIGRIEEAGITKALLSGPMRTLAVQRGDLIDQQWRVDEINERGLALTYKPTGTRQTLAFRMTP